MTDTPIRTTYVNPPIPHRGEDWWAQWSHHDGEDTLRGSGETELDAVIDLLQNSLDEDDCDDVIDMAARYWKSLKD